MAEPTPILDYHAPLRGAPREGFSVTWGIRWKGTHRFRVYVVPPHVWFIRLGNEMDFRPVASSGGDPLGLLLALVLRKPMKRMQADARAKTDAEPLDVLMPRHKLNRSVPLEEFTDVSLAPGGFWTMTQIGKWHFRLADGTRATCYFPTVEDMGIAAKQLRAAFGARLADHTRYDAGANRFVKR